MPKKCCVRFPRRGHCSVFAPHGLVLISISLVGISLLWSTCAALQYYLQGGETRCLFEYIPIGEKVLGEYTVSAGTGLMQVDLEVHTADGQMLYSEKDIARGKFAFVMPYTEGATPKVQHSKLKRLGNAHKRRVSLGGPPKQQQRKLLSTNNDETDHSLEGGAGFVDAHDEEVPEVEEWDWDSYKGIDNDELIRQAKLLSDTSNVSKERMENSLKKAMSAVRRNRANIEEETKEAAKRRPVTICTVGRQTAADFKRRVSVKVHTGKSAIDLDGLAKRENMGTLQTSLEMVSLELQDLMRELAGTHEHELALEVFNKQTSNVLTAYAVVSLIVMAVTGALQARYSRRYFKSKKLV